MAKDPKSHIEMATEAMGRALLEDDVGERYTLFKYAELRIKIAEIEVRIDMNNTLREKLPFQKDANIIADKQQDALTSMGRSLTRLANSIRQKKMS